MNKFDTPLEIYLPLEKYFEVKDVMVMEYYNQVMVN